MQGDDKLRAFYEGALSTERGDAARVGWDSDGGQLVRFEALLQAIPKAQYGPTLRLLDVGCGLGDLIPYLEATGRQVDYLGIDITPAMIDEARLRHPGYRFEVADVMTLEGTFDLVLCAGALGVRFGEAADNWRFVLRLLELAGKAAAFNLLVHEPMPITAELSTAYWHVDPADVITTVARLAPRYVVRSDVTPSDLIVYLYNDYAPVLTGDFARVAPRHLLADVHLHWSEAAPALEALSSGQPASSEAAQLQEMRLTAYARFQLDEVEQAMALIEQAIERDPTDLDAVAGWVKMCLVQARLDDAREGLERMLEARPSTASRRDWLRFTVHEALLHKGRTAEARLVEAGAEQEHGRCLMVGMRLLREGELDAAETTLEAVHLLRPDDLRAKVGLCRLLMRAERYPEALIAAAAVLDVFPLQPDARGVSLMAMQRLKRVDPQEREQVLKALVSHKILGPFVVRMLR